MNTDVVRVGGGSKSETMKSCSMYNRRGGLSDNLRRKYGALMTEKDHWEVLQILFDIYTQCLVCIV